MAGRAQPSFRTRTVVNTAAVLAICAVLLVVVPLVELAPAATLFGLPLRLALAVPLGLPALVLAMFWFAARQTFDEERSRDDD
jgi:hypothetical protein